jgi:hypothetical protein
MSRFPGWTMKDVERLNRNLSNKDKAKNHKVKKIKKNQPDYVGMICAALSALKIEYIREYKFLHDRRFRFDIAIPRHHIAIEFEGGIWNNGRHTRGKGYASDVKKYNLATMYGWKLLRYTTEDTKEKNWEFKIAEEIRKFIQNIQNPKKIRMTK